MKLLIFAIYFVLVWSVYQDPTDATDVQKRYPFDYYYQNYSDYYNYSDYFNYTDYLNYLYSYDYGGYNPPINTDAGYNPDMSNPPGYNPSSDYPDYNMSYPYPYDYYYGGWPDYYGWMDYGWQDYGRPDNGWQDYGRPDNGWQDYGMKPADDKQDTEMKDGKNNSSQAQAIQPKMGEKVAPDQPVQVRAVKVRAARIKPNKAKGETSDGNDRKRNAKVRKSIPDKIGRKNLRKQK